MIVFEYRINKKKTGAGVSAMGLVEAPAIEVPWKLHLSKEEKPIAKLILNKSANIVTGPVMIPNIKIYRSAESLGMAEDGYIFFTEETIKKASEMFLENELMNKTSINHEEEGKNIKLVESWLIIDAKKDKAAAMGYDLPVGTWMCSYKVNNPEILRQIESGELTGFSIEADNLDRVQILASEEKQVISDYLATQVIEHFKKVGQTKEQLLEQGWELMENPTNEIKLAIESDPNAPSKLDRDKYLVRFYYKGPRDNKNRLFCAEVLDLNLWYRKEDIDQMSFRGENSEDFGIYSIFKYEGSYGCRHVWDKNYFSKSMKFEEEKPVEVILDEEPTEDEIIDMFLKKIEEIR